MAIVPQDIRPFVKRTSIPAAKAAAQRWLASVTTATNAPTPNKSALKARLDYGRSLSRITPTKEALSGYAPPSQDQMTAGATNLAPSSESKPFQEAQTGQAGLSTLSGDTTGVEAGGNNLNVEQYITILTILPQESKQQPIQAVFSPPALTDFATKAQQSGMINTAGLLNSAIQGNNIPTMNIESTAQSELGQIGQDQVGQQPSSQAAIPEATTTNNSSMSGMDNTSGFGEPQVVSALRRKFIEAKQNPFVKMDKNELAHLYDLEAIKGVR